VAGTVAMTEEGAIVEVEGEVRGAAGAGDVDGVGTEVLTVLPVSNDRSECLVARLRQGPKTKHNILGSHLKQELPRMYLPASHDTANGKVHSWKLPLLLSIWKERRPEAS
jgi:hypothetical protein